MAIQYPSAANRARILLCATAAAALCAGSFQIAHAEAADADAETTFESVIVTARKRDEAAQTVPIAIDTFNQRSIDRLGVQTIEDLRYSAPSVYIAPSTFRQDTLNVTIRGQQNFQSTGLQFDTSAAVYVDGVYYARPVGLTGSLYDVGDVEVLKGPQGTLVGRNSTGGAILYNTKQPTNAFGGYAKGTLGEYGRREIEGALNVPVSDKLFVRGSFSVSRQTGYVKNIYSDPATGYVNTTPGMGYKRQAGQLAVKWVPTDDFSLLLRAKIAHEDYTGVAYNDLGYFVGTTLAAQGRPSICNIPGTCTGFTDLLGHVITPYYANYLTGTAVSTAPGAYNALINSVERGVKAGFWTTQQVIPNTNVGDYQTYSAVADKAFGKVDVRLLTAYRTFQNKGSSAGRGLSYITNIYNYRTPQYRSYQTELTLNGEAMDDRLKYTAGLFYFRETSPNDGDQQWLYLPSAGTPAAAGGRQITYTDGTSNGGANTSYAAYSQATYNLAPATRLTAGVRYTIDKREALLATRSLRFPATPATTATIPNAVFDPGSYTLQGTTYTGISRACAITNTGGVPLPPSACSVEVKRTYKKPTWTLAIDHDLFDKTLVYATARSGYRSGAINSGAINPAVITADPERVQDYEIGIKSDWSLGGVPLRTNLAAYYTNYRDIQIQATLPNVTLATAPGGVCTQALFNAGQCLGATNDATTLNAKKARIKGFEASLTAMPIEGLTLNLSGSYLDAIYTDYNFTPPPGYLLPTGRVDLSGTPFPLPKTQINASATYEIPLRNLGPVAIDGLELSYHFYRQSKFEADLRSYNAMQRTSPYSMSDVRLNVINLGGRKVDFSAFVKNVFNKEACIPEPQGVLNSAPNATFGVGGTSGVLQCVPLPPRMTGASLTVTF